MSKSFGKTVASESYNGEILNISASGCCEWITGDGYLAFLFPTIEEAHDFIDVFKGFEITKESL